MSMSADDFESCMPLVSDFVKRLYKMLEDPSVQQIVSWSSHGDTFVVKDLTEFTLTVLPKHFKHSNFASFVRQLNKYDFHKIKTTDDGLFGDQSWTFHHPNFNVHKLDKLMHIKRKTRTMRPQGEISLQATELQSQLEYLCEAQAQTSSQIRNLDMKWQDMRAAISEFQHNIAQQDQLMQALAHNCWPNRGSGGSQAGGQSYYQG